MLKVGDRVRVRPFNEVKDHRCISEQVWNEFGILTIEVIREKSFDVRSNLDGVIWTLSAEAFDIEDGNTITVVPADKRKTTSIDKDTWNELGVCKVIGSHIDPKTGIPWLHIETKYENDWYIEKQDAILYSKESENEEKPKMKNIGKTFTHVGTTWTIMDSVQYPWMQKPHYICKNEHGGAELFEVNCVDNVLIPNSFAYALGDRVILKPYNADYSFGISEDAWKRNRVVTISSVYRTCRDEYYRVIFYENEERSVSLAVPCNAIAGKIEDVSFEEIIKMESEYRNREDVEWMMAGFMSAHGTLEGADRIAPADLDTIMNRTKEYMLGNYSSVVDYMAKNKLYINK